MRACERYIDLMMRSIDRETTPREEAELRAHMDQCAACRALYEAYRAVDTGISALEEEPPGDADSGGDEQHPHRTAAEKSEASFAAVSVYRDRCGGGGTGAGVCAVSARCRFSYGEQHARGQLCKRCRAASGISDSGRRRMDARA